jgi:hypothetical protein
LALPILLGILHLRLVYFAEGDLVKKKMGTQLNWHPVFFYDGFDYWSNNRLIDE